MSYQSTVLALNPIRYYPLSETSGVVAHDLGSQAQNGTINGTITKGNPGLVNGDLSTSIKPDGSTGYISLPTTGLPTGAQPWTIGAITRMTTIPGAGNYQGLVLLGTWNAGQAAFLGFNGDAGVLTGNVRGAQEQDALASPHAGFIYTQCLTYDGSTLSYYINGVLQRSNTVTVNLVYGNAWIGKNPDGFWPNPIQGVVIFNRALSSSEVASLNTAAIAGGLPAHNPTDGYGIYESSGDVSHAAALSRLDDIASYGFKLVINYDLLKYTHIGPIQTYINHAASVGLKVIVDLSNPNIWKTPNFSVNYPLLYADSGNQTTVSGFDTYIVNQLKGLAGTWGYYVADEPATADHAACLAHAGYIAVADSTKPRLLISAAQNPADNFNDGIAPFADCCDVGGDDFYPVGYDLLSSIQNPTITVASGIQNACSVKGIQSAIVLQAFAWQAYGSSFCTPSDPNIPCSYIPYRYQMDQQNKNAQGNMTPRLILWFSYQDIQKSPTPISHMQDLQAVISSLVSALGYRIKFSEGQPLTLPNSTIQSSATVTDANNNPQAALTGSVTVYFSDGTTSAPLTPVNAGAGIYTLTYTTRGPGPHVELWSFADGSGNTLTDTNRLICAY